MIPILYDSNETAFTSNGIGRLSDCISCTVTEERNGVYECEFEYPVTGVHFDEITLGRIIYCTHDEFGWNDWSGTAQPFDIYASTKPIDGIVTFYAHHISYRLNEITVKPFVEHANSGPEDIWNLADYNSTPSCDFNFIIEAGVFGTVPGYTLSEPVPFRQLLGGMEGSILDLFGGEFAFVDKDVVLYGSRGSDKGVSVRYGKNLVDYNDETDYSESYTAVLPYWIGTDSETDAEIYVAPSSPVSSGQSLPHGRTVVVPLNMTDQFENQPTAAQLTTAASTYLTNNSPWLAKRTIEVDFVQLWQTEEFAEYAPLMQCGLCDTVHVTFPRYGMVSVPFKVVKVVWNVLLDRYDSMTLGTLSTSFADVIEAGSVDKFTALENKINDVDARSWKAVSTTYSVPALSAGASGYWTIPLSLTGTYRLITAHSSNIYNSKGLQLTPIHYSSGNAYINYYAPQAVTVNSVTITITVWYT